MGLFSKRDQDAAPQPYEISDERGEWLDRMATAPLRRRDTPPTTYWVRKPGETWRTRSLCGDEIFDDLVRFYPEGTEFELAQPPGRDA